MVVLLVDGHVGREREDVLVVLQALIHVRFLTKDWSVLVERFILKVESGLLTSFDVEFWDNTTTYLYSFPAFNTCKLTTLDSIRIKSLLQLIIWVSPWRRTIDCGSMRYSDRMRRNN
jgi:hypothetical protein